MLSVVPSIIATTIPRKEMPLLHKRITTPMNFYLTRWKVVPVKAYLIFIIKSQFFSVSRFIMSLLVFVLRVETWPSPESIQVQSLVKQSLKLFLYTYTSRVQHLYGHLHINLNIIHQDRKYFPNLDGFLNSPRTRPINFKTLQYLNDLANNKLF